MNYPKRLLPQNHFKKIEISDIQDSYSLIRSTKNKDLFDPITRKIKEEHIVAEKDIEHLKDYSTNLFGTFTLDDNHWQLVDSSRKKELTEAWEEGEEHKIPRVPEDIIWDEAKGCYYIPIKKVQNAKISVVNDNYSYLEFVVIHTPIKANFWHISIRLHIDGKRKKNWGRGLKKLVNTTGKSFLLKVIDFNMPENGVIPEEIYIKH